MSRSLSPRERGIVDLLIRGASTREMSTETGLTLATINTYVKRISEKLNVHSRVEMIAKVRAADNAELRERLEQEIAQQGTGAHIVMPVEFASRILRALGGAT